MTYVLTCVETYMAINIQNFVWQTQRHSSVVLTTSQQHRLLAVKWCYLRKVCRSGNSLPRHTQSAISACAQSQSSDFNWAKFNHYSFSPTRDLTDRLLLCSRIDSSRNHGCWKVSCTLHTISNQAAHPTQRYSSRKFHKLTTSIGISVCRRARRDSRREPRIHSPEKIGTTSRLHRLLTPESMFDAHKKRWQV